MIVLHNALFSYVLKLTVKYLWVRVRMQYYLVQNLIFSNRFNGILHVCVVCVFSLSDFFIHHYIPIYLFLQQKPPSIV